MEADLDIETNTYFVGADLSAKALFQTLHLD
ncbi:hypothetical protein ALQ57_102302 [Pseudomonas amygdali pv. hibisci]|uniref:Uncharacterized protein n=15 Tax=Pseudomonas syringae group TaxID=136849 RepID=A0AAX1VRY2_PSEAJ|nr:hypothetical protein PsgB076_24449 [Pseudomonas savastanoi pv. glycinea str. B076]EGH20138.1 hypothetical protein PSYMO_00990 [Pseudomonas amygdali pv. mori str. 301020]KPW28644.1 hypothetical protein ALO51_102762 [Pseudomonas amygdali]KPW77867.1 hypothetical protein ALO78_102575 [Pseudomonas amygdali pv. ciccaronei]KPW90008.1 hypothetical protein ALO79_100866 [Pseudomonas syringae pv. castaneae]KPW96008.1 hypothetical protein ALO50_103356 [Pseudomonas syringae pv. cerasicola]KPX03020.1 hy